jgi:ABC-type lipoprotein export system ATPase subunit
MNPIVQVEEVSRVYAVDGRQVAALSGVNLEIAAGSFVALKGRSGSGKTTLLNIIGGLDRPTTGQVYLEGQSLADLDEQALTDLRRRRLGFVFQSFALIPTYSAFENVEFALRLAGCGVNETGRRAVECLRAVGLGKRLHSRPDELSGGQQQRVAVARAMANHPALILADEPTGELDSATTRQVLALLRHLVEREGVTLLVASHDPLIDEVADQVVELRDGKIEQY